MVGWKELWFQIPVLQLIPSMKLGKLLSLSHPFYRLKHGNNSPYLHLKSFKE